jgi:acyl carrier protein
MATVEILDRLTHIIRNIFDDDDLIAVAAMTAKDVDGWDSLSNLRLIMAVEKEFKVKFSAAEVGKLKNLGELAEMIVAKSQR